MSEQQNFHASLKVEREDLLPIADLRPRIDGNHTHQSSLMPLSVLNDDEDGLPTPGKNFRLLVLWTEDFGCRIFADLSCITETYLTGTTIILHIKFDNDEVVALSEAQAKALAKWAAHIAYDFAALSLRQLCANNPITKDIDLPITPLEPEIDVVVGGGDKPEH